MKPAPMEIAGPLQIVGLEVENYKRLRVVRLSPTGKVVELTGKNRQGKTSLLDAIWSAFKAADVGDAKPIHDGANKARIKLNLGEIVVTRTFTEKGGTLTVESKDGRAFGSPQRMLDEVIGQLAFDPLAFTRMKAADQYAQLRSIVPLEVDVDKLEGLNKADFDRRTDINREAKAKRAQAEGVAVPADAPTEPVDEKGHLDKIEQAAQHNANIERRKQKRAEKFREAQDAEDAAKRCRARIEELRRELEQEEANAKAHDQQAKDARDLLANAQPLPEPIDLSAERTALERAQAANAGHRKWQERERVVGEAERLEEQATELTGTIEARTKTIRNAIAEAKMPIAGLALGNGQITYNGQPFSQSSGAETLMVSMAIGMAANPKVRVILIRDASLLDNESMKIVMTMAEKYNYQVWLERVSEDQNIGVHIVDGEIVAINGAPVKSKVA